MYFQLKKSLFYLTHVLCANQTLTRQKSWPHIHVSQFYNSLRKFHFRCYSGSNWAVDKIGTFETGPQWIER